MSDKWIEMSKKCIGMYMSGPCAGPGWNNPGYYQAIYEITEKKYGDLIEVRTRMENGAACREYSEGYKALDSLYSVFLNRAIREDKKNGQ